MQGLPGSLDLARLQESHPASRPGTPAWIDELSTIGYYFQSLKSDSQLIMGLCYHKRLGDQQIADEMNGEVKRKLWNAHKVKETREKATLHLDGVFRDAGLIANRYEYS